MLETVNTTFFLILNAPATPNPWLVDLARYLAVVPIWLAVAIVAGLWVWGAPGKRGALLAAGSGLVVSLALAFVIVGLWYHPRPADLGLGHILVAHEPETSFPSDHATFLWAIGFSLVATRAWRGWGWIVSGLGLATAWARIYLGVHFPLDMAGAFVIALIGAAVARTIQPRLMASVLPLIERPYKAVLRVSRLPPLLFPREENK
jgi:undecaprenyl-diphosphatase